MSYVIELDGQRIEAETEKEARAALRKLRKEREKAQTERDESERLARLSAYEAYARTVDNICEIIDDNSRRVFPVCSQDSDSDWAQSAMSRAWSIDSDNHGILRCECEGGTATATLYGTRVVAILQSGNGYVQAVRFDDSHGSECWAAVGVYADTLAWVHFPARIGAMIDECGRQYWARKAEQSAVVCEG
jgi:hypothetical protein